MQHQAKRERWINFRRDARDPSNKRPGWAFGGNVFPPSMRCPSAMVNRERGGGMRKSEMPPCRRNVSIFFGRININCVINKSERKEKEEKKGREKSISSRSALAEKTSGSKYIGGDEREREARLARILKQLRIPWKANENLSEHARDAPYINTYSSASILSFPRRKSLLSSTSIGATRRKLRNAGARVDRYFHIEGGGEGKNTLQIQL